MKLFLIISFILGTAIQAQNQNNLIEAINSGNEKKVESELKKGEDIYSKDKNNRTTIELAILRENPRIVKLLTDWDSNILFNNSNPSKNYLITACEIGNEEIVDLLLEKGINVNSKNRNGENCLDIANAKGYYGLLNKMENRGLHPMDKNNTTYTVPLYLVYIIISILMTIWVARTLHINGKVFLVDSLKKENLADSVNHLLVVGFYLINIGFITLALKIGLKPNGMVESIEILSHKVGMVLVVLGLMHFFNLFMFGRLKKKTSAKEQST